ncbi:MAG: hypothetical protein RLO48_04500 [Bauldia litoralis]
MDQFRYLVIAAALVVAGCDNAPPAPEPQSEAPAAEAPAPAEAEAPATPAEAPAAEPQPQSTAGDTTTVTNDACLAAVKAETNESDVTVASNEFSEANTIVMLGVGANRAPWKCLVANDGTVQEITFTGDDSAGVPEQVQDEQPAASSSDVTQAAIDACLEAVQAQTNEPNQGVLSTEFSEANSLVMVGVGDEQAPWKCLVSNDGVVAEVSFDGDEGEL